MEQDGEPRLIQTERADSVFYKGRMLYSRSDPVRSASRLIASLRLRPQTLALCFSPLLGYGLDELLGAAPDRCFALAVERDEALYRLSLSRIPSRLLNDPRFVYIRADTPEEVAARLKNLDDSWITQTRRRVRVDLSGGVSLYPDFYARVYSIVDDYINSFWKNKLTLIHLGRLYAKNLIQNAAKLPFSLPFPRALAAKPIAVVGAGPSLRDSLEFIARRRDRLYIIAADAALKPLAAYGIYADAVVLVESQFAIESAFVGTREILYQSRLQNGRSVLLFADLTSFPRIASEFAPDVCFFLSEFAECRFLSSFCALAPRLTVIPPLGSVGLAALELALRMRRACAPVFLTGLDFSFFAGRTHAENTPQHEARLRECRRLNPIEEYGSVFDVPAEKARSKDGRAVYTNPALKSYARLMNARFGQCVNLYDIGKSGLPLGAPRLSEAEASKLIDSYNARDGVFRADFSERSLTARNIALWLEQEADALRRIRFLLSSKDAFDAAPRGELNDLLARREYLYLHFPDKERAAAPDESFLKRVSAESMRFLKYLTRAREILRLSGE